jgi:hypothetical protein
MLVTGHGIVALIASRPAFGPVLYSTTIGSLGTLNTTMAVCRGTAHIGHPVFIWCTSYLGKPDLRVQLGDKDFD